MPRSKKKKRRNKPHSSSETVVASECGTDEITSEVLEDSRRSFSNGVQDVEYREKSEEQQTSTIETDNCMQSADLKATIESTKKLLKDIKNMDKIYQEFVVKTGNRLTQEFFKRWEEALRDICKLKYESASSMEQAPIVSADILIKRKLFVKASLDKSIRDKEFQSSCSFYTLLGLCLNRYIRILESLLPLLSKLYFITELGTVKHFFNRWNDALEVALLGCDAMSLIKAAKAFDFVEQLHFTFNYVREKVTEKRLINNLLAVSDFISKIIKERSKQNYQSSKNLQENYVTLDIIDQRYELQWEIHENQSEENRIYCHFVNSTITAFLRFDNVIVSKKNQAVSELIQAGLKKLRSIHQRDCLVGKYTNSDFSNNSNQAEEKLSQPLLVENELSQEKQLIENHSPSNCDVKLSDKDDLKSAVPEKINLLKQFSSTSEHSVSLPKESSRRTEDSFLYTRDIATFLSSHQPSEDSFRHLNTFTACANDFESQVDNISTFVEKVGASKSREDESSAFIISQMSVDDTYLPFEKCTPLREDASAASFEPRKDLCVQLDETDWSVYKLSAPAGESTALVADTVAPAKEIAGQVKEPYMLTKTSTISSNPFVPVFVNISAFKEETHSSTEELANLLGTPSLLPESRLSEANIFSSSEKNDSLQNENSVPLNKSQSSLEEQAIKLESAAAFTNDSLVSVEDHNVSSIASKNTDEVNPSESQSLEISKRLASSINKDSPENFSFELHTRASIYEDLSTELLKESPVLPKIYCKTPKKSQELLPENHFPGNISISMIEEPSVPFADFYPTKKETCNPVRKMIKLQVETATLLKKDTLPVEEGDSYKEPYILEKNLTTSVEKVSKATGRIISPDNVSEVFGKSSKVIDFLVLKRENSSTDGKHIVLVDEPVVILDEEPEIVENVCPNLKKSALLQKEFVTIMKDPWSAEVCSASPSKWATVLKESSVALKEFETLDKGTKEISSSVKLCPTIVETSKLLLNKPPVITEELSFEQSTSTSACNKLSVAPLEELSILVTESDKDLARICEPAHNTEKEIFISVKSAFKASNSCEHLTTFEEKVHSRAKVCTLLLNEPTATKALKTLEKSCSLHFENDSPLSDLSESIDEPFISKDDLAEPPLTVVEKLNISRDELAATSKNTEQILVDKSLPLSTESASEKCARDLNTSSACKDSFKTCTENFAASLTKSVSYDSVFSLEDFDTNKEMVCLPTKTLGGGAKKSAFLLNSSETISKHTARLSNDSTGRLTKSSLSSVLLSSSEPCVKFSKSKIEGSSTLLKESLTQRKVVVSSANKKISTEETSGLNNRRKGTGIDGVEREWQSSVETSPFFKTWIKLGVILLTLCIFGAIFVCCVP